MDKAIELISVTKEYPLTKALDDVTFSVKKGTLHGFLGPNGAGKSTTMKIITGMTKATSGELYLFGEKITKTNRKKHTIGYLPENPPLYNSMRVIEYLDFVAKLWQIPKREQKNAIERILETCSIKDITKRIIGNLSKGYKQRVGLAQALIHDPKIIILDEPLSGLDPRSIGEIRELIKKLAIDHTVMLSTHQLHEVALICDHISIINQGKIIKSGKLNEIQNHFNSLETTITAELLNWNSVAESAIKSKLNISNITTATENELTKVQFKVSMDRDIRANLSTLLMEQKCVILDFKQEQNNLENIFNQLTKEEQEVQQ